MAGVIKAGATKPSSNSTAPTAYNFDDIAGKAQAYFETVKLQAAQLIERANQQAAQIQAQAEAKGKQAAYEAAKKAVYAEFDQRTATLLPALQKAIELLQDERLAWVRRWENSAIRLASAIAERVIRRELAADPKITETWIREALELGSSGGRVRLLLHPDDYKTFEGKSDRLMKEFGRMAPSVVEPDESVPRGGCRVVTDHGHVEQSLEAQLRRIQEELVI